MAEQTDERAGLSQAGVARLTTALVQGGLLYWLYKAAEAKVWPATEASVFAPLALIAAFVPMVLLAGVARMRRLVLIVWTAAATALMGGLAWWDVFRIANPGQPFASPQMVVFGAAALFIAHHLIEAADVERRVIAPYPAYFDTAWKHGVQLALALAFTGAFWLLLMLGSALFALIGLKFFGEFIAHEWFAIPATTLMFAAAVQLTDVRVGIIRGIRTVALTLLSWLTPLMGLIAIGFLVALPFTGLNPLWETRAATALLLIAAAALVVLLNAAYQDGADDTRAPLVLRWAGRATALALTPLVALAAYGLWLRVGQHGWTPDRIIAAACVLVAAGYAVGYAVAALRPGPWLQTLEPTNVVTAVVALGLICALFSPLADPARISVADQVRRLERGEIAPDQFDYAFLRFDGGRWGNAALERLKTKAAGPHAKLISEKAAEALKLEGRAYDIPEKPQSALDPAKITAWPKGRTLPESFVKQAWTGEDGWSSCIQGEQACDAFFADLDADGTEEVLLSPGYQASVYRFADGRWKKAGELQPGGCEGPLDALKAGRFKVAEPRWKELEAGGQRLRLQPQDGCETSKAAGEVKAN